MEKKAQQPITEEEFESLIKRAKANDPIAILKIIEIYKDDILRLSKFIYLPDEDAISEIVLEFLEFLKKDRS